MSFNFKPKLKFTDFSGRRAKVRYEDVPVCTKTCTKSKGNENNTACYDDEDRDNTDVNIPDIDLPTVKNRYYSNKKIEVEQWNSIHMMAFSMFTDIYPPNNAASCSLCSERSDNIICKDCGMFTTYCVRCEQQVHKDKLHTPEVWQVGDQQMTAIIL